MKLGNFAINAEGRSWEGKKIFGTGLPILVADGFRQLG